MLIKAKEVPDSVGLAGNLSVSGKVIRVFERKAGKTDKGNYSFQNAILQDDTGEMTICLKNRKEEWKSSDVDRLVTLNSSETKNGILGVKIDKDVYKDKNGDEKTSIKVVITGSAKIIWDSENVKDSNFDDEEEQPATQSTKPAVEKQAKPSIDLTELRKETIKICFDAWKEVVMFDDIPPDSPDYWKILEAIIVTSGKNADTLFICQTRN